MNTPSLTTSSCQLPQGGSLKRNKNFLLFPRPRRHKSSAQNIITPRGAHRFSSIFSLISYIKKAPPKLGFCFLLYCFAVVENERAVKEEDIAAFKIYKPAEIIRNNLTYIDKSYLCVTLDEKRRYAASEGVTENDKLFVRLCVRIFDGHKRY